MKYLTKSVNERKLHPGVQCKDPVHYSREVRAAATVSAVRKQRLMKMML